MAEFFGGVYPPIVVVLFCTVLVGPLLLLNMHQLYWFLTHVEVVGDRNNDDGDGSVDGDDNNEDRIYRRQ
ncbi:unnamed protein product [Gongylonema pulchrum]|uniref:V-type proton ATPase subunit a n=1 Tax=Gongylonema pulchrum TaxID=637853 RepID=A0A183DLI1_9BILA|nr:unnamed protein product [Gongylonema pulchrum]